VLSLMRMGAVAPLPPRPWLGRKERWARLVCDTPSAYDTEMGQGISMGLAGNNG